MQRPDLIKNMKTALKNNRIAGLLGPRQCGKTTITRIIAEQQKSEYFDLENPTDLSHMSNPMLTLENLSGLVITDEIQRKPELFEVIRVIADQPDCRIKFLIYSGLKSYFLDKNIYVITLRDIGAAKKNFI